MMAHAMRLAAAQQQRRQHCERRWSPAPWQLLPPTLLLLLLLLSSSKSAAAAAAEAAAASAPKTAAAAAAAGAAASTPGYTISRPSLVLFGDSITEFGNAPGGWVNALALAYVRKADVVNRGLAGWNTRWALLALPQTLEETTPGAAAVAADTIRRLRAAGNATAAAAKVVPVATAAAVPSPPPRTAVAAAAPGPAAAPGKAAAAAAAAAASAADAADASPPPPPPPAGPKLQLLVIWFGANDAQGIKGPDGRLSVPLSEYRDNLAMMVAAARAAGVPRVLLVTPPPVDEQRWAMLHNLTAPDRTNARVAMYAAAVREVGRALNAPVLDVNALAAALPEDEAAAFTYDGLHPSADGAARIAEWLAGAIGSQAALKGVRPGELPLHWPAYNQIDAANPASTFDELLRSGWVSAPRVAPSRVV